jgi:hypothetical protein
MVLELCCLESSFDLLQLPNAQQGLTPWVTAGV